MKTIFSDPKMKAQMDEAMKAMASMPPEQRKQMEQMMAKQGLSMSLPGGPTNLRVCVSKEMASRDIVPMDRSDCTQKSKRSGNRIDITFQCTNPKTEDDLTMIASSDMQYTMVMKSRGAKPEESMEMRSEGQWLSADCGAIKPMVLKP